MRNFLIPSVFIPLFIFALAASALAQDEPIEVELPDESEWEQGEEAPPEEEPPAEEPPAEQPPEKEPPATPPPAAPAPSPSPQFYEIEKGKEPQSPPPPAPAPTPAPTPAPAPAPVQPAPAPPPQTMPPTPPPAAPPPADTAAPPDAKQPQLMEEPVEDQEEKEEIFGFFTLAPELGYVFYPKSEMTVHGISATVEPRNGFIGKLHLDIGGDGLAFELAPLFAVEAGGITTGANFGSGLNLNDGLIGSNMVAVGGQIALVYRFELGRFFPSLGLSFHGTYMFGSEIEYGTELYGRIPVGFTIYAAKNFGIVFEAGFMYGVTGIRTPFQMPEAFDSLPSEVQGELEMAQTPDDFEAWYYNNEEEIMEWLEDQKEDGELPEDYSSQQMAADFAADQIAETIRFGQGFGIDLTIGIRFP